MQTVFKGVPLAISVLIASFLCPTELSIYLGGLRLPPHRVVLLILLPIALVHALRGRDPRPTPFDLMFLSYGLWTLGVIMYHHGDSEGLQSGGALALESLAGYLVPRVFIRDAEAFKASLRLLLAAVAVAVILAIPEAFLGQHFVHDALFQLTGYAHPRALETRMGLTRAYATFDHPIHLGSFCASILAMVWFANKARRRVVPAGIIAGGALLALSSAPLLGLGLQFFLIGWHKITARLKNRVVLSVAGLAVLYGIASVTMTRSPIAMIATGMTLDAWTGFYRLLIWEYGLLSVSANPWAGIGFNEWERPEWMASSTVDAFWLVVAMRGGLPALVLLGMAILLLAHGVARRTRRCDPERRRLALGWSMSMIALCLLGCTVHFWNVLHAYFFFVLGLGAWMASPMRQKRRASQALRVFEMPRRAPAYAGAMPAAMPRRIAVPHGVLTARALAASSVAPPRASSDIAS